MKRIKRFEIWRPGDNKKQLNDNITIVYVCGTSKQYVNKYVNMRPLDTANSYISVGIQRIYVRKFGRRNSGYH